MHDCSISGFNTNILFNSGGVKLVLCVLTVLFLFKTGFVGAYDLDKKYFQFYFLLKVTMVIPRKSKNFGFRVMVFFSGFLHQ